MGLRSKPNQELGRVAVDKGEANRLVRSASARNHQRALEETWPGFSSCERKNNYDRSMHRRQQETQIFDAVCPLQVRLAFPFRGKGLSISCYVTCQPDCGFKRAGRQSNALTLGEESDVSHILGKTGGAGFSQDNSKSTTQNDTTHVGPLGSLGSTLILV